MKLLDINWQPIIRKHSFLADAFFANVSGIDIYFYIASTSRISSVKEVIDQKSYLPQGIIFFKDGKQIDKIIEGYDKWLPDIMDSGNRVNLMSKNNNGPQYTYTWAYASCTFDVFETLINVVIANHGNENKQVGAKSKIICKECNGTGKIDMGFYVRDCMDCFVMQG